MHNGSTSADLTEYAILEIGTIDVAFNVTADGTNMTLNADNNGGSAVDIKTERVNLNQ